MASYIEEFKYILSGCKSLHDALYFANIYCKDKSDDIRKLIISLIYAFQYTNVIDINSLNEILVNINNISFENNENNEKINTNNNDKLITKIFMRISNILNKQNKIYLKKKKIYKKNCPHCNRKYITNILCDYVICGFEDERNGFNWDGCGRDWCFKCEKKLCKSWASDKLFFNVNRYHDSECCKLHAKNKNNNYLTDYCHCNNHFVNR